jgi:segregation and condensation protein B
MSEKEDESVVEVEQIGLKNALGAIVFAARQPMTAGAIRKVLQETAQAYGAEAAAFGSVKEAEIKKVLLELQAECAGYKLGFHLIESADGYRFQSDPAAGPWVRHMLDVGKPTRLSRPALETLAIIAYRQPIARSEIEGVRGVAVDHIIRLLMEMQLIRIVGRSELAGRPMLYGTTALFLEHFGLKDLKDLPGIEELARLEAFRRKQAAEQAAPVQEAAPAAGDAPAPGPAGVEPAGEAPADAEADHSEEEEDRPDDEDDDSDEDEFDDEDDDDEDDDDEEDDDEDDEDEDEEEDEDDEDEGKGGKRP